MRFVYLIIRFAKHGIILWLFAVYIYLLFSSEITADSASGATLNPGLLPLSPLLSNRSCLREYLKAISEMAFWKYDVPNLKWIWFGWGWLPLDYRGNSVVGAVWNKRLRVLLVLTLYLHYRCARAVAQRRKPNIAIFYILCSILRVSTYSVLWNHIVMILQVYSVLLLKL